MSVRDVELVQVGDEPDGVAEDKYEDDVDGHLGESHLALAQRASTRAVLSILLLLLLLLLLFVFVWLAVAVAVVLLVALGTRRTGPGNCYVFGS